MRWTRTDDISGHKPDFSIRCPFCDVEMVMRYSHLFPNGELLYGMLGSGNQLAYKCHSCGYHQRFNVDDDKDYIEKILKIRGKEQYNPVSDWEQNEEIKKQLENLGYFG